MVDTAAVIVVLAVEVRTRREETVRERLAEGTGDVVVVIEKREIVRVVIHLLPLLITLS